MSDCRKLESLFTPYVDGELEAAERDVVAGHVRRCPPCHGRVDAERAVRTLLHARRDALTGDSAPASLHGRCASRATIPGPTIPWHTRLAPFALAASLVVIVGGAFVYELTDRSARVMAAELTADHMKCFAMNAVLGTHQSPAAVESAMVADFGWRVQLPGADSQLGLRLVGARPCLYGEGRIAHVMYRHDGRPVSLFMLPRSARPGEVLDVMGHEAAIWSAGDRTFVLIAEESRPEVQRMAAVIQAAMR